MDDVICFKTSYSFGVTVDEAICFKTSYSFGVTVDEALTSSHLSTTLCRMDYSRMIFPYTN